LLGKYEPAGAGVGKTQLVKGKLAVLTEEQLSLTISFNYFTDVCTFQKGLESALEKKAGVKYGPPGTKQLIYFIDDINMPKLDPYETAMPISLIRQHLGWGHWYDALPSGVSCNTSSDKAACGMNYCACNEAEELVQNLGPSLLSNSIPYSDSEKCSESVKIYPQTHNLLIACAQV
jgi:hypothetical protein